LGITTKNFVDSEFQRPYAKEKISLTSIESTIYYYFFSQKPLGSLKRIDKKELYLEFIDNILNAILFNYSFDSSNDFNLEKRNTLILNKSNKQDIISLFGDNNGEVLLPSNLLGIITKDEYAKNIPEGCVKVMIYYYGYSKKIPFSFNDFIDHKKFLLLYLNQDDILVKMIYDELDTQ